MARDLGTGHREAHVGEQPAGAAIEDVTLGLGVRLGGRCADDVDPELPCEPLEFGRCHIGILPTIAPMKAIRIHEDGGPEVLRYEDAPDPVPEPGEVLIRLKAVSLNHIDLWVRSGRPS